MSVIFVKPSVKFVRESLRQWRQGRADVTIWLILHGKRRRSRKR